MGVVLVSTVTSLPFARRLSARLGVALADVERRHFPDGESSLRFGVSDWLGLLSQDVVLVGATESSTSIDDIVRLGCAASKYGARSLVLVIPYYGYSTMERAVRPGEVVTAKTIAHQLSAIPRAGQG